MCVVTVGAILLVLTAMRSTPTPPDIQVAKVEPPKEEPPKEACPVKLLNPSFVQEAESKVAVTVRNISSATITAAAFGITHTDKFGDTFEPYRTDLSFEHDIKPGASRSVNWEVLIEERTKFKGMKPGSTELYLVKIAFADGRTLRSGQFGACGATF